MQGLFRHRKESVQFLQIDLPLTNIQIKFAINRMHYDDLGAL